MEKWPPDMEGSCKHKISSRGQPTRGGLPAWGLGKVVTSPHSKDLIMLRSIKRRLGIRLILRYDLSDGKKKRDMRFVEFELSKRFAGFKSLNDSKDINRAWENIEENMKISAKETLGLFRWKQYKP
jgi:hypothetical protein